MEAVPGGRSGRKLVLVADRDPVVRELVAHFLGKANYAVEVAADGRSALEAVGRLRPDVLITEVLLPQMDGLSLCRRLKADGATHHLPVLVFSILAAGERAREAGAEAFLLKPLAERVLVDAVAALLAPSAVVEAEGNA